MATLYQHDDRHRAIRLDALAVGTSLILIHVDPESEVGRAIGAAASAVLNLDDEAARLVKLGHLTPAGRMAQLKPLYDDAAGKVSRAEDAAKRMIANIDQSMRLLAEPDALDATDAAGAIRDVEIRQRFATLAADDRARLLSRIVEGDAEVERIGDALLRDPFPSREVEAVRAARREQARDEAGATWTGWEKLRDAADAALVNVAALREVLKHRPAGIGPEHVDSPVPLPTT